MRSGRRDFLHQHRALQQDHHIYRPIALHEMLYLQLFVFFLGKNLFCQTDIDWPLPYPLLAV
jgi:hypothetical protein